MEAAVAFLDESGPFPVEDDVDVDAGAATAAAEVAEVVRAGFPTD